MIMTQFQRAPNDDDCDEDEDDDALLFADQEESKISGSDIIGKNPFDSNREIISD